MLHRPDVVEGALVLLDREGLDRLTTRRLGDALGVRSGALYRHFPDKASLLDAMAEKIVEGVGNPLPDAPWDVQLSVLANRLRAALLAHRDGARVVAGTYVAQPNNHAAGSAGVAVLCRAGVPVQRAGWLMFACMYYVLGHTLEEQARLDLAEGSGWAEREAQGPQPDPLFEDALRAVVDADAAERFSYGLEVFIAGVRATIA